MGAGGLEPPVFSLWHHVYSVGGSPLPNTPEWHGVGESNATSPEDLESSAQTTAHRKNW